MVNCPYCGKLTDPKLDGCPHCGGYLKKKQPAAPKQAKSAQNCPNCRAVVQSGDIICVVCGTNLLTGQKVADAAPSGGGGGGISLGINVTGVIAAIAIVVIGLSMYYSSGDPVERAREYIDGNDFFEANELLSQYVETNPDDDEAWFLLGKLNWMMKKYGDAAASFQTVVNINPTNDEAGLLGVISMRLSSGSVSVDQEIALLRKVAQNSPDNAEVWYLLAMALAVRGNEEDIPEQTAALERVLDIDSTLDFARLDLAISQVLNGNTADARASLASVSNEHAVGNAKATQGFINAYERLASSAVTNFEEALGSEYLSVRWQTQTALAKLQIEQGQFREAEQQLQSALTQNPNNDQARYLHGIAYHALSRANEALAEYESVMRSQNDFTGRAAVQAANIQLLLGDTISAERSIGVARRAGADTPAFHTVNGRIQSALNDTAGALRSFNTALQMDPGYASAYLERGIYYVQHDRVEDGVDDLTKYLNLIGREGAGTSANDIRLLLNQLQRSLAEGRG